jgi:hypothetical protein
MVETLVDLPAISSPDTSGLSSDTHCRRRCEKSKAVDGPMPNDECEPLIAESTDSQVMAIMGLLSELGLLPKVESSGVMLERLKETLGGWE